MKLEDFLTPGATLVGVSSLDKTRVLTELSARAAQALGHDASEIARAILKREELGSTGMGGGIAIPHARLTHLDKPFGLLARLRRPVEFDAIDGKPVDLVFLLLQPLAAESDLNALAAVARALRDTDRLGRMRSVSSSAELFRAVVT
jgi:nitrogen PTS system EIIA component